LPKNGQPPSCGASPQFVHGSIAGYGHVHDHVNVHVDVHVLVDVVGFCLTAALSWLRLARCYLHHFGSLPSIVCIK
jgi:hypothetical protein